MKKTFKKVGRIIFLLFICVIAVFLGFIFFTKEDEISIPSILGMTFLIVIAAMLICAAIAFIFDAVESLKRDKVAYLAGYFGSVAVLTLLVIAVDYFWGEQQEAVLATAIKAFLLVGGSRGVEYVFRREKN